MRDPTSRGYRLLDAVKGVQLSQRRNIIQFATAGTVLLCILILSFFFLYNDPSSPTTWSLPASLNAADVWPRTKISLCDGFDQKAVPRLLQAEAKYEQLLDDKFTIVIQTYKRPGVLNETLHHIIEGESKMLDQIIIAWNDLETPVPEDWISPGGIPIHYQQSDKNSLNQKLKPNPRIKTKGVLLGDDDTFYTTPDMEFAFKTWRETGQSRLVGAWPRLGKPNKEGRWRYIIPRQESEYNMILTGLTFVHMAFLDYYSSSDVLMTQIRDYVDEHFNCEDIAMNYMTQYITGCPTIYAKGKGGARLTPKPKGMPRIGNNKGHLARRTACLNDFNKMFGRNPLKNQAGFLISAELHAS